MPELGPYGSVRGARGNSRPYRESAKPNVRTSFLTHNGSRGLSPATRAPLGNFDFQMTRPLSGELLVAKLKARRGIDCEYLFKRKDCSWFRIRIARQLPRGEFFAGLFTLGCVSGLASPIIRSVSR